ncbi:hypothetical protein WJX82_005793 [Trebouxia sp. C0006]
MASKGYGITQQDMNMLAVQARIEAQYLSALQTPISYHRFPKTYNPIGRL